MLRTCARRPSTTQAARGIGARQDASAGREHIQVLVDEVDEEGAIARSKADAPEIDGQVFIDGATHLKVGELVDVIIEEADEHDMWAHLPG